MRRLCEWIRSIAEMEDNAQDALIKPEENKLTQSTEPRSEKVPKKEIPLMPVRLTVENTNDFTNKISEWKEQYGGQEIK
ncbi:MAG: hypothetical protein ABIP79_14235 [Chitinophagaceae bacterium]